MLTLRKLSLLGLGCFCLLLSGCASTRRVSASHPGSVKDPFEGYNRAVYSFNTYVDKIVYKPIAHAYRFVVPHLVDKGVGHFFANLGMIPTVANDLLQADFNDALSDSWRFLVNSTVGLGGILDVATPLGIANHSQDFGLTLAKWGVRETPYLVLPFLGPTTLRDCFSIPVDHYLSPWPYVDSREVRNGLLALKVVQTRARLLKTDKLIAQAFDPYAFVRDAYLQQRAYAVNKTEHLTDDPFDGPTAHDIPTDPLAGQA